MVLYFLLNTLHLLHPAIQGIRARPLISLYKDPGYHVVQDEDGYYAITTGESVYVYRQALLVIG